MPTPSKPLKCPRCAEILTSDLYGPCDDCRLSLREMAMQQTAWRRLLYYGLGLGFNRRNES